MADLINWLLSIPAVVAVAVVSVFALVLLATAVVVHIGDERARRAEEERMRPRTWG